MIITAEDSHARVSHLRLVLKPTLDTTVSHPAWLCAHCRPSTLLPSLLIGPAMNPILVWRKLLESTRGWAGPKESFNGSSYLQGLESAEELNSYMLRWYHRSSHSFSQVILLVSPCFPPCFQFQIKRAGDPRGNMLNQTLGPARASICSSLRSCSSYSCGLCFLTLLLLLLALGSVVSACLDPRTFSKTLTGPCPRPGAQEEVVIHMFGQYHSLRRGIRQQTL